MTQVITGTVSTPQARTGPMPTSGRWGWYRDHEGREFRRVSTLVKKVETDRYNLDQWMLRQVAEGLAIRDDLMLAVKSMGRPNAIDGWTHADKTKLNGIVKDAMAAAKQADGARRGTAYHDLTERLDRGEPIDSVVRGLPAGAAQMLRAYAFLRRENAWVNVEIERTVVCDELECAGTFDRVDLVPGLAAMLGPGMCQYEHPGTMLVDHVHHGDHAELPVVVDVKSEAAPWLNGLHIGPQLATYSRARKMWVPTGGTSTVSTGSAEIKVDNGEYVAAPCVRQDVAIVVHVTEKAANPYFINLTEGWEAAQAAYAQMERETRAKRKLGNAGAWFAEVPGIRKPAVAEMLVEQAAFAGHGKPESEAAPVAQEAYRRDDGMVDWRPADTAANVYRLGALDDVDRQAIEAIWSAGSLDDLAKTYEIYTGTIGRSWAGRVAEAGAARRAQVECAQRALHTGGGAKCACGWDSRFPA